MTEETGPMFLRGYAPATDKPKTVAPIKYFEVGNSSFEMLIPPKPGRKAGNKVVYPFLSLQVGQSFNVPLEHSEVTLRVNMNNAEKRNTGLKFRLIKHSTHYEIGRVFHED